MDILYCLTQTGRGKRKGGERLISYSPNLQSIKGFFYDELIKNTDQHVIIQFFNCDKDLKKQQKS